MAGSLFFSVACSPSRRNDEWWARVVVALTPLLSFGDRALSCFELCRKKIMAKKFALLNKIYNFVYHFGKMYAISVTIEVCNFF